MSAAGLDLAYLRERPENLERLIEHQRIRETPIPGGDTCVAQRLTLDDGTDLFTKTMVDAPAGFFEAEAAGLGWLSASGTVAVPEVIAVSPSRLVLTWVQPGPATAEAMAQLGRELAGLHASGAPAFGASAFGVPAFGVPAFGVPAFGVPASGVPASGVPASGVPASGFIGRLPLDNNPGDSWPAFYAEQRVRPFLRQAVDAARIDPVDAAAVDRVLDRVEDLSGQPEPPARLHGDLWGGNVLCGSDGRAYLVDPAAHGGHRETDLAMLSLFDAPFLDVLLVAYEEITPLAPGWRERVALHQLHPLLVHTALFGGAYGAQAGAAARRLG